MYLMMNYSQLSRSYFILFNLFVVCRLSLAFPTRCARQEAAGRTGNAITTTRMMLPPNNLDDSARRFFLQSLSSLSLLVPPPPATEQPLLPPVAPPPQPQTVVVPIHYIQQLSAYVLYYSIAGDKFGAILDTGSPFLTIPGYTCSSSSEPLQRQQHKAWGCYRPEASQPSGLPPTFERFDNNQGQVEWRKAPFSFLDATGSLMGPSEVTFGVLDDNLMSGPGGVFFGLVRDTDQWIRPSFLGQTTVRALEIDLSSPSKSLTLSTAALIPDSDDYVPLVNDLKRRYKDPTLHYTARAQSMQVNGRPFLSSSSSAAAAAAKDKIPVYVIFDTGVTGMVVSRELLDERYAAARKNRERALWGTVDIDFETRQGQRVTVSAQKPVTTPLGERPWPSFKNAHLIVVGLAFLDGHKMTIDIDQQKLRLD